MIPPIRFTLVRHVAAALLLAACLGAHAQGTAPAGADPGDTPMTEAEAQTLHDYVLSMDKLRNYAAARNELRQAALTDGALADELKQMGDEPEATLADLKRRLIRHQKVLAYYTGKGLGSNDVMLLPLALNGAWMARRIKDPARYPASINPDQVQFVAEHVTDISKLNLVGEDEDEENTLPTLPVGSGKR